MRIFLIALFLGIMLTACAETPVACTEDAKVCDDGIVLVRDGPDCKFPPCPEPKEFDCGPLPDDVVVCTMQYDPVCGWFNQNINCLTYPCADTYSNGCVACSDENVDHYTMGECPT